MRVLIDHSIANDMQCDTRSYLRHVQNLRVNKAYDEEPGAREAGSLFHEAFAAYFQYIPCDFGELYAAYFLHGTQEERLGLGNLARIYEYSLENIERLLQGFTLIGESVERVFVYQFAPEIYLTGTIDALVKDAQGSIWVLEHKTTGSMDMRWCDQWYTSAQGMIYKWGAEQLFPGVEVKGMLVHGLELRVLPPYDGNMEKKCSSHKVKYKECQGLHIKQQLIGPIRYTQAQEKMWQDQIYLKALHLQNLRNLPVGVLQQQGIFAQSGNKGNLCRVCEYKDFCHKAGREFSLIQSMMHVEPDRFDVAREILQAQGIEL